MGATPKILQDVMGMPLTNYQLVIGYILELKHSLMGFFPAVITESEEIVVCLTRPLLEEVWNLLPKKRAKIREILLLVNLEECFGFDIQNENKKDTEQVHILSEKEFTELKKQENPFKWTPGLIPLHTEMSVPSPFK